MPIRARSFLKTFARALLLVAVIALIYSPAWHGTWLWDDSSHVPAQRASLYTFHGLWHIWTDPGYVQQYYPLMFTTVWLAHHAWGFNLTGYHAITLMFHAANALLAVWLLRVLGLSVAWWAALLFAMHPVEVESVAWISELKNTQSTFFYLLSLISLLKSLSLFSSTTAEQTGHHRRRTYFLSLIFFMAALFSKTVACTMPVTALILFWFKRGRWTADDFRRVVPHLFIGALLGLGTAHWEKTLIGASGPAWTFSIGQRFLIAGHAFWFYIGKLLWPHPLIFIYPRWDLSHLAIPGLLGLLGLGLLVLTLVQVRHRTGRGPLAAFAIFAVVLAPALGFENTYPMRYTFVADHYQYAASLALLTLLAAVIQRMLRPAFATTLLIALSLVFGGLSWNRAHAFSSSELLWKDTLSKNPNCRMAHDNLAFDYFHEGNTTLATEEEWKALRLPEVDDLNGDLVMGELHLRIDRNTETAFHYFDLAEEALKRLPPSPTADVMRLSIDVFYSRAYMQAQRPEEARARSLAVLHEVTLLRAHPRYNLTPELLDGTDAEVRARLAELALADHHDAEALEWLKTAAQSDPNDEALTLKWASLLVQMNHPQEAAVLYEQILHRDSQSWVAHNALGLWDEEQGLWDQAIAHDRQAIGYNPNLKMTRERLASLLLKLGRKQEALAEYQAEIQADQR